MRFQPKSFTVTEWYLNPLIISSTLDPEISEYRIITDQTIDYQPFIAKSKKFSNVTYIGIKWIYTIINKPTQSTSLIFGVEDEYSTSEVSKEGISSLILASYVRLSEEFEARKSEIGIRDALPDLEQSVIDGLLNGIIELLK